MKTWFDTAACQSSTPDICRACRTSQSFRASIAAKGMVPDEDFECPNGYTPDNLPEPGFRVRMRKMGCKTCQPVVVVFKGIGPVGEKIPHGTKNMS